ncbi:hypothetical protein DCC79_07625 [bacterium]|nr:MAG: hypothetical protein DCC79_07625 [bacterium]
MSRTVEDALQACLAAIEAGAPVDAALGSGLDSGPDAGPDALGDAVLRPLVTASRVLAERPGMDPSRRAATHGALLEAAATLYPPPAPGLAARLPSAPVMAVAVGGLLLVAMWAWRSPGGESAGPAPRPQADAVATRSVTAPRPPMGVPTGHVEAAPVAPHGRRDAPPLTESAPSGAAPAGGRAAGASPSPTGPGAVADVPTPAAVPPRMGPEVATVAARRHDAARPGLLPGIEPTRSPTGDLAPANAARATVAASATAPAARPAVTGRVLDTRGAGIGGAMVTAYRVGSPALYVQRSGADGAYSLRLQPGSYRFRAAADGFLAQWYSTAAARADAEVVAVAGGRTTTGIDFVLQPTQHDGVPGGSTGVSGTAPGPPSPGGMP